MQRIMRTSAKSTRLNATIHSPKSEKNGERRFHFALANLVTKFACHLVSCNRLFLTPKARRLHLIQAHGYPKEYFFAVTNKGVGGLLKKWGEGATLIRGEWKPRDTQANTSESDNPETETRTSEEVEDSMHIVETRPVVGSSTFVSNPATFTGDEANDSEVGHEDYDLEALRDSMTSLSLVPSAIRFGRGGKAGGFGHRGRSARVPHQSFHYALGDRGGSSGTVTAPLISMTAGTTPPDRSQMSGKDTSGAVYTNAGRGRRIRGAGRRGGSRGSVSG
ncbi:hypothetical protein GLOTRDRAFT_120769 [Gloeophyllum trabeum ATCC 11539]|uniref:C2H2-type domain-containing protein n=1 Tax=Gloeophyllum trabeum (strain ATCC 11539 / FP-39264 / Madison 617) TaxID=670483 RepID=S7RSU1_GLOTA|nr:uncharacterized protein GLOTRDRAFT_120769 [Gloeophyllum trabeum ATCC 11539]EPQ56134.1 hypothetical protein GLOTRDRAFT_120769 [Gloeophyllum trabeum ATCC 11539]